ISVRHLKHDQRTRGRVFIVDFAAPLAGTALLLADQLVADRGIPRFPVVPAGEEIGLDGVIVAVEIVPADVGDRAAAAGRELADVRQAPLDVFAFEDAGVVKRGNARRRTRKGAAALAAAAGAEHVAESAIGVLAFADVIDGLVDHVLLDLDPR